MNTSLKTHTAKELDFIFDEEILISDDFTNLDGYLWATDSLVKRLMEQEKSQRSVDELFSINNINFYPIYNPGNKNIVMEGHYYYWPDENLGTEHYEIGHAFILPLTDLESTKLIESFEKYCKETTGCSCLEFLNKEREYEELPLIKSSLSDKIKEVSAKTTVGKPVYIEPTRQI